MQQLSSTTKKQLTIWLGATLVMVLCMVFIGGVTRLTDSGLSMVQWRPLLGAIPPMNEVEWTEVFNQYKQFPEYKIVNHRMNLEEFKFIFFWEYFHRLFGRMIGLVFIVPYLFFFLRKKLTKSWNRKLLVALVLGGSQGLLGWFMVKSGLVERPDVSHFRLAAHFSLALLIMGYIFWLMLKLKETKLQIEENLRIKARNLLTAFSSILCVQIVYGAFVAGLDAGIGYNTFPRMGKNWIPRGMGSFDSIPQLIFESNVGVQFIHRCLGWILFAFAIYFIYFATKKLSAGKLKTSFYLISGMVFIQFILGVSTILTKVQISWASAHQMGACVLTLITIKTIFDVIQVKKEVQISQESANKTTA